MDVTDEIKARIDIVDFISRYVPLKRAGRSYKANCPFHQEKTPSFVVFPESGTWRCFGACATGGDIFSFLMKRENMDFRDAIQELAREAGIQLEEPQVDDESQIRERLYVINAHAAQFFRNQLHRHSAANEARSYLQRRGINAQVAESFQLGFAPESWDSLRNHLLALGYTTDEQHQAGVLKYNEDRDSYYDAFRNRLIIPIADRQGRITGFGGRVLDKSVPKYLNTADTPIFNKSQTVYGLDRAHRAIREADAVVIVEGYMDVIAAHQFGYNNVVACLGTALTEDQLRQLQRYTNNFVLALDADNAGQQATIRGLNGARQALKRVRKPVVTPSGRVRIENRLAANLRIVALTDGKDPDDIIRKDPQGWPALVQSAQPLVDFFINVVSVHTNLESAQGKAEAVAELVPLIAELDDEIERQHYTQQLSRLVQIDEQTIAHRVQAAARTMAREESRKASRPRSQSQDRRPSASAALEADDERAEALPQSANRRHIPPEPADSQTALERFLLANLLQEPNLLVWLAGMAAQLEIPPLGMDELQRTEHQQIFFSLKQFITGDELWDLEAFQETLSPNLHGRLADLIQQAVALPERNIVEMQEAVLKAVIRLRRERLREDLYAMQFLLQDAQQTDDREAVLGYSTAINAHRRDRHHLEHVLQRLNRVSYGSKRFEQGIRIA
ncbi:MAG: DNA primase [Caldilineaceae bacterium]|nr:DNA primase [Caldilineaceae bacterium]